MRFAVGLAASVLLHAALVLPWLMPARPDARAPQREQLVVDLLGMVTNRQVEQLQAARPSEPPPASPPKPAARRETRERTPVPRQTAPSTVQVARPVEASAPVPPTPPLQVAAAPSVAPAAEEDRAQQTVRVHSTDADALRKYLASLRKAIQSRLVYPAAAREAGYAGVPKIRFVLTESGEILTGSLAVQKSSGYASLDDSAMHAALASAPFDKPPRQMAVAIDVAFVQE